MDNTMAVTTDRDYVTELRNAEKQISTAQQDLGRLQAEKNALSRTKAEIVAACAELGVTPNREKIEAEIEKAKTDLNRELTAIDTALKS